MRQTLSALVSLTLLLCLALPLSTSAQPPLPEDDGVAQPFGRIDPELLGQRRGPRDVVIELAAPPTAVTFAQASASGLSLQATTAEAQLQLAQIQGAQQRLLAPLARLNAQVIYRTQRVYNGIAVRVDTANLDQIAQLPGVKAIHPLRYHQLDNSSSVPLIGAPELWSSGGAGVTGEGLTIAIIDSGIDYLHAGFAGTENYATNNPTVIEPGTFPTAKVVGGTDLVGDDYVPGSSDPNQAPKPDPDPIDCAADESASGGHGTHVAGTAAGTGVNADGTTYTGPYNTSTDFDNLAIGPGVAPEAKLLAVRVFSCASFSTGLVDLAIEYSVDPDGNGDFSDRADVINMSLGSQYGNIYSSSAIAAENAAALGTIVVASAGNSGDVNYVTGSPAAADSVISVASTLDALNNGFAIKVNSPSDIDGNYLAVQANNGPALTSTGVTGDVVYAQPANGCAALTNAADVSGKMALIDRGTCTFATKVDNAQKAGAIAVIVVNNTPADPITMDLTPINVTVPAVMITQADGATIKGKLPTPGVNVTIAAGQTIKVERPENEDTLSSFSSRGPRSDGALKPDIAAPGDTIYSPKAGTGSDGLNISGTSMAAPHVAGAMALLKQLHPTWSVQELKALAMNTATQDIRSGSDPNAQIYAPARIGAGRIDLPNAAEQQVIAFDAAQPNRVSVSFGTVEVTGTITLSRQVSVVNKGTGSATFNLAYSPVTTIPGVTYTVAPAQVTLAAGATATATVTMNANPAQMKHSRDATLSTSGARHWLSDASGYLTMSPTTADEFVANIRGYYENPPVTSPVSGVGTFTYNDSNNQLSYNITFSRAITLTGAGPMNTGGHIHRGAAGANGPIAYDLTPPGTYTSLSGNVTITDIDEVLLLSGGLYVNFHTAAFPAGEVRGQIVPATPTLRVPVYVAARPASNMRAASPSLGIDKAAASGTATISLTGTGVSTGLTPGLDEQSIVTAYELQHSSPQVLATSVISSHADLQYVGVTSTYTPTAVVSETTVVFGVATYGSWASPNEVEFDIYIDTDLDGGPDFVLFNWNTGSAGGSGFTDTFISFLCPLDDQFRCDLSQGEPQDFINGVPAPTLNTVVFNNSVMAIPVAAEALGLEAGNSTFNYEVYTFSRDATGTVDSTPVMTYDVAAPGVRFSGGLLGLPAYPDVPGQTITVNYDRRNYFANESKGVLLLHHHNVRGARAEAISAPSTLYLPLIFRS